MVVSKDRKRLFNFSEGKYILSTFQRSSSIHFHITSKYILTEELKRFCILYRVPIITNDVKNFIVR